LFVKGANGVENIVVTINAMRILLRKTPREHDDGKCPNRLPDITRVRLSRKVKAMIFRVTELREKVIPIPQTNVMPTARTRVRGTVPLSTVLTLMTL